MNTYLKYKPVSVRIFVMISLILGITLALGVLSIYLVGSITGLGMEDLQSQDYSNPQLVKAQKILLVVNSIAVFLIPSLLYAYFTDPRPLRFLRLDNRPSPLFWAIAGIIMLIAMPSAFWLGELNKHLDLSAIAPSADKWMREAEAANNKIVEAIIRGQQVSDLLVNMMIMALLPAVSEELFFRGLIQKGLTRVSRNVWVGILASAFIFSAFHMQFLTFLTRFELGIILGILFWYSGSLWVPILAHFIFNGVQVAGAYLQPSTATETPSQMISPEIVGVSFLLVIGLVLIMIRKSTVTMSEILDDDDDDLTIRPKNEYTD